MMKVLLIAAGAVIAGGVAATPAIAGVAGNPSFSHTISVPVPSTATTPHFADDHGRHVTAASPGHKDRDGRGSTTVTLSAAPSVTRADDHGDQTRHAEPA